MMRFLMACASLTVFSWKQCSSPGTPCVLDVEPTAMISLSYLRRAVSDIRRHRDVIGHVRDVHVLILEAVGRNGLHLEETFRHDEIDSTCIDEVTAETCGDLAERLDEGADGDGSDRGS